MNNSFKIRFLFLLLVASGISTLGQVGRFVSSVNTIADLPAINPSTIYTNIFVAGYRTANDGGEGQFTYVASSAISTNLGTVFKPASGSGRWLRQYSGALDVRWFGALGDGSTDDTTAFQSALDSLTDGGVLEVPAKATSYRISSIVIKKSGTTLRGVGGTATLLYSKSTGGDNNALIEVDKTVHNANVNYKDIRISDLRLDGNNNALYGIRTHGFTRRCSVRDVAITACVCPMRVTDGYYSTYESVEFSLPPSSIPSGMAGGTYAANLYGVYLDTCNDAHFYNCIFEGIGAAAFANTYIAVIYANKCEGLLFEGTDFENMNPTDFSRYVNTIISAATTTISLKDTYVEKVDAQVQAFLSWDLSTAEYEPLYTIENMYINQLRSPLMFAASQTQGIWSLKNVYADGLDISDRVFSFGGAPIATSLNNVILDNVILAVGPRNTTFYDANSTTNSKQGLISQPIVLNNWGSSGPVGYVKSGYVVSLGATYVAVTGGEAVINGQSVMSGRVYQNARLTTRIYPDLTVADTWNVKISSFGSPYIERQSAVKTGSAFCPTIATFTTPGGSGAPAGLSASVVFTGIPVSVGGTGATTLTGILYGNGTGAVTAGTGTAGRIARFKASSPGLENSNAAENDTTWNYGGSALTLWRNNYAAIEVGGNTAIGAERTIGAGNLTYLLQNSYIDPTANDFFAISTGTASAYFQGANHRWRVASSVTAGAAITWEEPLEIEGDGDVVVKTDNLIINTAGKGLRLAEGGNARMGTAVLNGASPSTVTVANTSVSASTRIFLTINAPGAAPGFVYVSARVAATSFTITGANSDTSTVGWLLIEPAP